MLNSSERAYFTNMYYAASSVCSFTYTLIAAAIKSHFSQQIKRLIWANSLNAVIAFLIAITIFILNVVRFVNLKAEIQCFKISHFL